MVNSNPIEVYCTRPNCTQPTNFIPENILIPGSFQQQYCGCCGMPLILKGNLRHRFLALRLLVPDDEGGGFGRTFFALDWDASPNRQCVIKQLHPKIPPTSLAQRQKIEQLFRREEEVLKQLDHPQIPQGIDFAVVEAPRDLRNASAQQIDNDLEFYIVQQYIEGQNLAKELDRNGKFSESQVIDVLQQILPVLDYIHNLRTQKFQGFLHRDIKPSNIMRASQPNSHGKNLYLIDFGAVKQVVVAGVPTEASCILGSPDYMPPEQLAGEQISASSDLYSLAATCICLLTSQRGRQVRNGNWTQYTMGVSDNLASILNRMLLPDPQHRYQSAQEVIDCIQQQPVLIPAPTPIITPPLSIIERLRRFATQWRWVGLALLVLLGLAIAFAIHYFFFPPCSQYDCNTNNGFSWGEEVLIKDNISEGKKTGTEAFEKGNYKEAIMRFQESLKLKRNDPEALIYLNNAYAALKDNPIRIAVSIPISNKGPDVAQEMLRGVAHVQSEVNCGINNYLNELDTQSKCNQNGINGRFLQVWIANDREDPTVATDVAKAFGKNQQILGVIGPYSSKITSIAGAISQKNNLVLISPASTISRSKLRFNDYVFRTAYTDATEAEDLVSYMMHSSPRLTRAVIVKQPDGADPYSDSLSGEFEKELRTRTNGQGQVKKCILDNNKRGQIAACIQSNQNTADVVLVALTRKYLEGKETVFFIDNPRLKVLGGDTMYSINLKDAGRSAINEKLVVSVPWNRNNDNDPFEKTSAHLWGKVNWRTAMTYDATKAMVEALKNTKKKNPSRPDLSEALLRKDFSTKGATGQVAFCRNADRKLFNGLGVLVKVQDFSPDPTNPQLDFVIMDTPTRNEECP